MARVAMVREMEGLQKRYAEGEKQIMEEMEEVKSQAEEVENWLEWAMGQDKHKEDPEEDDESR